MKDPGPSELRQVLPGPPSSRSKRDEGGECGSPLPLFGVCARSGTIEHSPCDRTDSKAVRGPAPYTDFCRTQAFHPPRLQRPCPTSLPSTGARRVTPATLSGTVQAPPHVSIRLGSNVPAPHHCHRPVRGALHLLRSAERSRLRVICPFRVALGREQRVGPVGSLGHDRGRQGLAAGTKPAQRLRHQRQIRVKSRRGHRTLPQLRDFAPNHARPNSARF
jgi:hypothetical protein